MYARVITLDEAAQYGADMKCRLQASELHDGLRVVVRIEAPDSNGRFGIEYGGCAEFDGDKVLMYAPRLSDDRKGYTFPLQFGKDDRLYSTGVLARPQLEVEYPETVVRSVRPSRRPFEFHHELAAMPPRPFGYVLDGETFAKFPIITFFRRRRIARR